MAGSLEAALDHHESALDGEGFAPEASTRSFTLTMAEVLRSMQLLQFD
ncbi:hypothetical protein [Bradyrhizobium sp.]